MKRQGRRYRLVLYRRMLDHWWHRVAALGAALFALAVGLQMWNVEMWRWRSLGALGVMALLAALSLFVIRNMAYVQARNDHVLLATPLFRTKISYKRILRVSTAVMYAVFPEAAVPARRRRVLRPVSQMTAVILELTGLPFPPSVFRLFLSPFFFRPNAPNQLVVLVSDWMRFSAEVESLRVGGVGPWEQQRRDEQTRPRRLIFGK